MLATSQDLGKLSPAWQTPSPSSPGPCGVAMAAGTVLDPENGRMQLATGCRRKGSLSKAGAQRLLCGQKSGNPQISGRDCVSSGSCLASVTGERQVAVAILKRQLHVPSTQRPRLATAQGSQQAHPTRQLFRGELLKQPQKVSKHSGG